MKITNFLTATNPEPQVSGRGTKLTELTDRVNITIGDAPTGGSTYAREKYRLDVNYKTGDNFWAWEVLELPAGFYNLQNGSMRLIGLWHNTARGRIGLWIDEAQKPRLQIENKAGSLRQLWTGQPRQLPTGKHQIALHIILGELTELYIDGVLMVSVTGNNLPYAGYEANQILYFIDGANSQSKTISGLVGYEIGCGADVPFVQVDPCADLVKAYEAKKAARLVTYASYLDALAVYTTAAATDAKAQMVEAQALAALSACRGIT